MKFLKRFCGLGFCGLTKIGRGNAASGSLIPTPFPADSFPRSPSLFPTPSPSPVTNTSPTPFPTTSPTPFPTTTSPTPSPTPSPSPILIPSPTPFLISSPTPSPVPPTEIFRRRIPRFRSRSFSPHLVNNPRSPTLSPERSPTPSPNLSPELVTTPPNPLTTPSGSLSPPPVQDFANFPLGTFPSDLSRYDFGSSQILSDYPISPETPLLGADDMPEGIVGVVLNFPNKVVRTPSRVVHVTTPSSVVHHGHGIFTPEHLAEDFEFPYGGTIHVGNGGAVYVARWSDLTEAPDGVSIAVPIGGYAKFFLSNEKLALSLS